MAFEHIGVNPILHVLSHSYDNFGNHRSTVLGDGYDLNFNLMRNLTLVARPILKE